MTAGLFVSSAQQTRPETAFGIAWRVEGPWKTETQDQLIANGDAILPGTLVHPTQSEGAHSILILLPDGQRILYECYLPADCAHSFRVPSLNRKPEPFAADFLARVHQVLNRRRPDPGSEPRHRQPLPQDEVLATLDPSDRVEVAGLAAALPDGEYTYNIRPLNRSSAPQSGVPFRKTSRSITLKLPSGGIYELTVFDHLGTPRIDLFVAAVSAEQEVNFRKNFTEAHQLMGEWNQDYQGWPVHEFQRAYLISLLSDIKPDVEPVRQPNALTRRGVADETAEPRFSPAPGMFKGDTAVTLACKSPEAVVHFTIDGSQPLSSSPVYSAPVMVTGTALTIKAFASAPGQKDSPVITGIFRIGD